MQKRRFPWTFSKLLPDKSLYCALQFNVSHINRSRVHFNFEINLLILSTISLHPIAVRWKPVSPPLCLVDGLLCVSSNTRGFYLPCLNCDSTTQPENSRQWQQERTWSFKVCFFCMVQAHSKVERFFDAVFSLRHTFVFVVFNWENRRRHTTQCQKVARHHRTLIASGKTRLPRDRSLLQFFHRESRT